MGHGMAKKILEKGYPFQIIGHRNREPIDDLEKRGLKEARNPAAMARDCEVIFLCVSRLKTSCTAKDQCGAHEGLIVVDCSTSDVHHRAGRGIGTPRRAPGRRVARPLTKGRRRRTTQLSSAQTAGH